MLISTNTELTYENSLGMSLTFTPLGDYSLISCEETLKNDIASESQMGIDGQLCTGASLDARFLTIQGILSFAGDRREMKRRIERVVNPTLDGTLTYTRYEPGSGGRRIAARNKIEVRPEAMPEVTFSERDKNVKFTFDLIAFNPFWRGMEQNEQLAFVTKLLKFPLVIPPGGFIFGKLTRQLESRFENVGDAAAGFRSVITAAEGVALNPSVINKQTGEYVQVGHAGKPLRMNKGDTVEIIAYPHLKKIVLNGKENGFPYLEPGSSFFTLPAGDNIIGYNAEENVMNLHVTVYYMPLYLGVS